MYANLLMDLYCSTASVQATPRDFGSIGAGQGEGEHSLQTTDATAREMAELQVNIAVFSFMFC
jgi:hypothetical protein